LRLAVVLEILHCPFVLFGFLARSERTKIAAFARVRVRLARVKAVLAILEFANHVFLLAGSMQCEAINA
jgi:hypothetical protein